MLVTHEIINKRVMHFLGHFWGKTAPDFGRKQYFFEAPFYNIL